MFNWLRDRSRTELRAMAQVFLMEKQREVCDTPDLYGVINAYYHQDPSGRVSRFRPVEG